MKVHVTVDEIVHPELYELLENTPLGKRAKLLSSLAYKALLLGNVGLINPDKLKSLAPGKGRNSSSSKAKAKAPKAETSNKSINQEGKESHSTVENNDGEVNHQNDSFGPVGVQQSLQAKQESITTLKPESGSAGASVPESGNKIAASQVVSDSERSEVKDAMPMRRRTLR